MHPRCGRAVSIGAAVSDLLRSLAAATAGVVGQPFLDALAAEVAASLEAEAAYVIHGTATDVDGDVVLPLRAADGAEVGMLVVVSPTRRDLDDADEEALRIFASRAGAEIERQRRETDLAASRMRIVQSAEDERRRIGRTLHDGAQQRLVALALELRIAQRQVGKDDAEIDRVLAQAVAALQVAVEELRELARGVHRRS